MPNPNCVKFGFAGLRKKILKRPAPASKLRTPNLKPRTPGPRTPNPNIAILFFGWGSHFSCFPPPVPQVRLRISETRLHVLTTFLPKIETKTVTLTASRRRNAKTSEPEQNRGVFFSWRRHLRVGLRCSRTGLQGRLAAPEGLASEPRAPTTLFLRFLNFQILKFPHFHFSKFLIFSNFQIFIFSIFSLCVGLRHRRNRLR